MLNAMSFDSIDNVVLQALLDAGVSESVHLEFKRDLYGRNDEQRRELLKDVSAFANALGGHLIIGINEDDGIAASFAPIADVDIDQELQRLESIIRAGVEPAIVGLRIKPITIDGGCAIVISVPRSINPPHRIIFKNSNRYYARNSAGAHELSMEELRLLFGERRSVEERVKAFIGERFLRIQANDGELPMPISQGVLVMHLVSLTEFGAARRFELPVLQDHIHFFQPIGSGGSMRINLDGCCLFRSGEDCHGYTQVFRDGSIEATTASIFRIREGKRFFPSLSLPEYLIRALSLYLKGLKELGVSPPIVLQISALEINGIRIGVDTFLGDEPPAYRRDVLHLPASIITEYRGDENYAPVIAEQMDFLWNAFDYPRCDYFDGAGNWIGRQQ